MRIFFLMGMEEKIKVKVTPICQIHLTNTASNSSQFCQLIFSKHLLFKRQTKFSRGYYDKEKKCYFQRTYSLLGIQGRKYLPYALLNSNQKKNTNK